MNNIFDVNKFNIISDKENYYFFRALNFADIKDIENGITKKNGEYIRIRTDRERWEETHQEQARWNSNSEISLEEIFNHIKIHYSKETNCISLSSNSNVIRIYGEGYQNKYVMVKIPKREMGQNVFNAGQYMLSEVEIEMNKVINSDLIDNNVKELLNDIDKANTSNEIRDMLKVRYSAKEPLDTTKSAMKKGIRYIQPHTRISNYQALSEEQALEKNKIVAKLTILEKHKLIKPLIKNSDNNGFLIRTIGIAFSSIEQIHYGDIEGAKIKDISKEVLDMFCLLQQVEGQDHRIINELEQELIKFVNEGKDIEFLQDNNSLNDYKVKDGITMYELTEGKVEYRIANSIVKNMFYLSKSQLKAREITRYLEQIVGNNPKYKEIIEYIYNNGFAIETEITTRQSNKGYKISESVNLYLKDNEIELVERIKRLSTIEQIQILENVGL